MSLARRDASRLLLGINGRFSVLEVASCLLGGYFFTFLEPSKVMRKFICLPRGEWLWMQLVMAHHVAIVGSFSGQPLLL